MIPISANLIVAIPGEAGAGVPVTARVNVGPPGRGVPDGGTTGQVLAKASADDYDTDWVSPGAASEITGLIEAGTNVTLTGAGTSVSPYVINASGGGGSGTVTSVSVTTANGVSGSVANADTTPAITITLGAITPTSVAASGNVTGANLSGTNTGDQTTITGNAGTVTSIGNLTGPVTSTNRATAIANDALSIAMTNGLQTALDAKQATLVSGTNIRTVNGNSLLGSTDLVISGGLSDGDKGDITVSASGATWTIDSGAVTLAKMANVSSQILIGRHANGSGAPQQVSVGNGIEFSGSGIRRAALTGDVTATAGSNTTSIADNAVTNAKLANMETGTVKVRITASTGDPEDSTFASLNAATFISPIEKNASFTISNAENGVPILLTKTGGTMEIELPFSGITTGWSQTFCLSAANPVAFTGAGSITGSSVGSLTQNQWFGVICTGSGTYRFI